MARSPKAPDSSSFWPTAAGPRSGQTSKAQNNSLRWPKLPGPKVARPPKHQTAAYFGQSCRAQKWPDLQKCTKQQLILAQSYKTQKWSDLQKQRAAAYFGPKLQGPKVARPTKTATNRKTAAYCGHSCRAQKWQDLQKYQTAAYFGHSCRAQKWQDFEKHQRAACFGPK